MLQIIHYCLKTIKVKNHHESTPYHKEPLSPCLWQISYMFYLFIQGCFTYKKDVMQSNHEEAMGPSRKCLFYAGGFNF